MVPDARPRVVVSVGTDKHPFDRLVGWVDRWAADNRHVSVFMQYGSSERPNTAGAPLISHAELVKAIRTADVVITHGGPSTVMDVRTSGRLPIVVPREPHLGEHIDGHQISFARHLDRHGMAILAATEAELHRLIDSGLADPASRRLAVNGAAVPPGVIAFARHMNALLGIEHKVPR
ncbi:MAG: glycosyltransferase [Acidimicrobiales bacterium]